MKPLRAPNVPVEGASRSDRVWFQLIVATPAAQGCVESGTLTQGRRGPKLDQSGTSDSHGGGRRRAVLASWPGPVVGAGGSRRGPESEPHTHTG